MATLVQKMIILAGIPWLVALAGCGGPVVSVDDAVMFGDKLRLVAYVEKEPVLGLRRNVEDVEVRFYLNGRAVGDDDTDDDGRASIRIKHAPAGIGAFEARALVGGHDLRATAAVYRWHKDRTIIAVDIDDTIAETEYRQLILKDRDKKSDPVDDSRKTLSRLARDYHIVYVTARPRFLLEKTRRWLADERFPSGPVVTARGLRQTIRPARHKTKMLRDLRDRWPNLLIGIGNNAADAEAYGANRMLCLIVPPKGDAVDDIGRHAVVLRDWDAVADVFEQNRGVLTDPHEVARAVKGKRMLKLPLMRWEDD